MNKEHITLALHHAALVFATMPGVDELSIVPKSDGWITAYRSGKDISVCDSRDNILATMKAAGNIQWEQQP